MENKEGAGRRPAGIGRIAPRLVVFGHRRNPRQFATRVGFWIKVPSNRG